MGGVACRAGGRPEQVEGGGLESPGKGFQPLGVPKKPVKCDLRGSFWIQPHGGPWSTGQTALWCGAMVRAAPEHWEPGACWFWFMLKGGKIYFGSWLKSA